MEEQLLDQKDIKVTQTDLSSVNFDVLKRMCAFQSGVLEYQNEYEPQKGGQKKAKFLSCATMPDVLPIQKKVEQ